VEIKRSRLNDERPFPPDRIDTQRSRRLNDLVDSVAGENSEKVILVLRFLIDAGELWLSDDMVSTSGSTTGEKDTA